MISIPDDDIASWLAELKPYQRAHLKALLGSAKSPEQAAELWLSARGAEGTIVFGGQGSRPFFDRFKEEFKKFVCGDLAYEKERANLMAKVGSAKTTIISVVSVSVAVNVGATPALLVPAVALMLQVVGKLGIRAWCADNGVAHEEREHKS